MFCNVCSIKEFTDFLMQPCVYNRINDLVIN